jgi:uncharacterized phage protein gp47/JayE
MTTAADILAPRTQAQLRDLLMASFPARLLAQSWDETQIARALVEIDADTLAQYEAGRVYLFDGAYITTAKGIYLDLGATWYGEKRAPARPAVIQVRLSDPGAQGPFNLVPGQILTYSPDPQTPPLYYRSTVALAFPKNGAINAYFAATVPGAAHNIPPGSVLTLASAPGVVVSTPPVPGTGAIVVLAGADAEGDEALRARCLLKLSLQGRGWAAATIEGLILDRFAGEVTRALVLDPWLPNLAAAWLAGPTGPVSPQLAKAAYDYLRARDLKPVASYPVQVYQADLLAVPVQIQLWTTGAVPGAVTEATARLAAFQATLGIGDGQSEVLYSRITDALDATPGVFGSEVVDTSTGMRLANFVPPFKSAPVFAVTWLPVKVV